MRKGDRNGKVKNKILKGNQGLLKVKWLRWGLNMPAQFWLTVLKVYLESNELTCRDITFSFVLTCSDNFLKAAPPSVHSGSIFERISVPDKDAERLFLLNHIWIFNDASKATSIKLFQMPAHTPPSEDRRCSLCGQIPLTG